MSKCPEIEPQSKLPRPSLRFCGMLLPGTVPSVVDNNVSPCNREEDDVVRQIEVVPRVSQLRAGLSEHTLRHEVSITIQESFGHIPNDSHMLLCFVVSVCVCVITLNVGSTA
jgi:hypothetical protein